MFSETAQCVKKDVLDLLSIPVFQYPLLASREAFIKKSLLTHLKQIAIYKLKFKMVIIIIIIIIMTRTTIME